MQSVSCTGRVNNQSSLFQSFPTMAGCPAQFMCNLHHGPRLLANTQLYALVCKRPREEGGFHHAWEVFRRRHLESIRNLGFQIGHDIPDCPVSLCCTGALSPLRPEGWEGGHATHLRISKRVNLRRNSPSIFTDRSPNTKNPPSAIIVSH